MRVVSLLPAATETCFALGVEPVAVSHECDYPPAARERPAVTDVPLDATGDTAAVNDAIADAAGAGDGAGGAGNGTGDRADDGDDTPLLTVDDDTLRAASPDLVLTQGICDVCAVDDAHVRERLDALGIDARVAAFHPHTLDDVLADLIRLGDLLDRPDRARRLRDRLAARIAAVEETVLADADVPRSPPRTVVLDWLEPPMVAGHWVPELVARAGGEPGLAAPGDASGPVTWDAVREYDPEALVLAPCGLSLDEVRAQADLVTDRPGWDDLAAVRDGRVLALDGNHLLNRPGPRLVGAMELLAPFLDPDEPVPTVSGLARGLSAARDPDDTVR